MTKPLPDKTKFSKEYLEFLTKRNYVGIIDRDGNHYKIADVLTGELPFQCTQPVYLVPAESKQ